MHPTAPTPTPCRALVAFLVLLAPLAAIAAPITNDNFSRSVSPGWGSSPQGQAYTAVGGTASDFSVSTTYGRIKLTSSANRLVSLPLGLTQVEGTARIALTAVPSSAYAYAGAAVRIQSSGTDYYYFRLKHSSNTSVTLAIQKIIGGSQTTLSTEVTVGTGYTSSAYYRVRFSAAGTNPTHLRAKAWPDGTDEPALWQVEITDSTSNLQAAGNAGIRAGANSTFAPLNCSYKIDDLQLHDVAFVSNLKTAMQSAAAGDILYFTGTHTGPVKTYANGTASAPIIVRGINATVQTPYLTTGNGVHVQNNYWRFDDFTIQNALKGFYAINAHQGVVTRVDVTHTGTEAFKFRRHSSYWDVVACSASDAGVNSGEYGEGFYVGDSSGNWETDSSGNPIPDTTGYITFTDCHTIDTRSDGYDVKEGSHDIKFVRCVADFSGSIEPAHDTTTGGSGFAFRGCERVQLIDCSVNDLGNSEPAFKLYGATINGVTYGGTIEYKNVSATNITNLSGETGAAMFFLAYVSASDVIIYTDYSASNVTTFLLGNSSYTSGTPANFVELTW